MINIELEGKELRHIKLQMIDYISFINESYIKNSRYIDLDFVDYISDLGFYNYGELIKHLEKQTDDYSIIKKVIYELYTSHSTAVCDLLKNNNKTSKNITSKERKFLDEYLSSGYEYINASLYDPDFLSYENCKDIDLTIQTLDNIIKKHSININNTLYRGQSLLLEDIEKIIKEKEFTFKNYISTSLTPIVFGGWSANSTSMFCERRYDHGIEKLRNGINVSWIIETNGCKGLVVGDLSWNPIENEVILPRDTKLKINRVIESYGNEYKRQFNIFAEVVIDE